MTLDRHEPYDKQREQRCLECLKPVPGKRAISSRLKKIWVYSKWCNIGCYMNYRERLKEDGYS